MSETNRPRDDDAARILDEEVERALGRPVPDDVSRRAVAERAPSFAATLSDSKLLVGITLAVAVVVGVTVALATGAWWAVAAAVVVHFLATFVVITRAVRMTSEVEKPDPATVARLEEAGVADPEEKFNAAIREASGRPAESPERQVLEDDVGDQAPRGADPAEVVARQQVVNTPSSEPSRAVPKKD